MGWSLCLALTSLWLSACEDSAAKMKLTMDRTSIQFMDVNGMAPPALKLKGSVNPLEESVYIGVAFTTNGLQSVAYDIVDNTLPIEVTPKQTQATGSGTLTDQIAIVACLDEQCEKHIAGSPAIISVTYTVRSRLVSNPAELSFTHVLGSDTPVSEKALSVQSPLASQWEASASPRWIRLSGTTSGPTPGGVSVGIDTRALSLGAHHGSVILKSPLTGETLDVPVTLQVKPATLSTTPSTVSLGGEDGLELSLPLALGLDTGGNAYDWTAEVDTGGGPAWLQLSSTSGKASSSAAALTVSADPTGMKEGVYSGRLRFTSRVEGQTVTREVPVSLLLAPHKLWVPDNGVGLVSTPSVSRLTHTVKVKDNWGLSTTPWTASADQPWLSVTPGGTSGGGLTLTANPDGLAADNIHYATVTLRYDDGHVRGSETIRVGLWVGSSSPRSKDFVYVDTGTFSVVATDPIRPYAYVPTDDQTVAVFNLYTASLVTTLTGFSGYPGRLAVSSDGSTLYVLLTTTNRVLPVDLDTFTLGASSSVGWSGSYSDLTYVRPQGHGLLLANGGAIYDPSVGQAITLVTSGFGLSTSASLDGSLFCGSKSDGATSSLNCYGLRYSDVGGGIATVTPRGRFTSYSSDVALTQDGSRMYATSGASGTIAVHDGRTAETLSPLTAGSFCCSAVEVGPDDRIYAADLSYGYGTDDVWVFDETGTLLHSFRVTFSSSHFNQDSLRISGDGRRLVALSWDTLVLVTPP
jgi:hypothetical protein